MKQFATKSETFSLVRPGTGGAGELCSDERAVAMRDSFNGWLYSGAPPVQQLAAESELARVPRGRRPLTSTDIIRVNRATIRESLAPRVWPPDVVLSFIAADVIKRK